MDLGLEHAIEWCSLHGIECMERLESREQEKIPENQQSESQSQNTVQVGEKGNRKRSRCEFRGKLVKKAFGRPLPRVSLVLMQNHIKFRIPF